MHCELERSGGEGPLLDIFRRARSPAYDALCSKQTSHTLTGARPQPLSGTGAALEEQPSQKPSPQARQ